ncbi:MAG: DivIVA domain-containing protein [Oscillospiraceae bacterium]|nr:DivIVA domain-containing protein [Oscillospiraceae bacterium]
MLPPHELKVNEFTRVLRGYNAVEVDEHIKFMMDKYAELYRHNNELERELRTATAHFAELSQNEEAIRRAMVNAQRAEHKIVSEAEQRAELLTRTARQNCDKILVDFRNKIRSEQLTLHKLRSAVAEFKEMSLLQYNTHLEFLNQIAPTAGSDPEWELTEEDFANEVLEQMKLDIAQATREDATPTPPPIPLMKKDDFGDSASGEVLEVGEKPTVSRRALIDGEEKPSLRRRALKKGGGGAKDEVMPGDALIEAAIAADSDGASTISFDPIIAAEISDVPSAPTQEITIQE